MFRKALVLTAIICAFAVSNLQAEQIQCTWVGGESGCWCDPSNWDCGTVPDNGGGNTFRVTIDAGAGEVEVGLLQGRCVNQLDCYGKVDLQTWGTGFIVGWIELILEDPNGLTNYGELSIDGSGHQFYINGNVTNTVGATLGLSEVEIEDNLYNLVDATIEIESENDVEGNLHNEGTIIVLPASDLLCSREFHNAGLIKLYESECSGDELFDNDSNSTVSGSGVIWSEQLIQNKGSICASAGSLLLHSDDSITNSGRLKNDAGSTLHIQASVADVNNQGTVEVNAGGGVVFDSNLVNEPNGIIKLLGGTLAAQKITQSANAIFEGQGNITGSLVIETEGLIRLTGPTNIFSSLRIDSNATLEISDGTTLITSQTTCNGTIHIKGGRIIPQGGISGACNIIWEPGTYSNIADFNLDGQVNFKDFAYFADTWLWRSAWR